MNTFSKYYNPNGKIVNILQAELGNKAFRCLLFDLDLPKFPLRSGSKSARMSKSTSV